MPPGLNDRVALIHGLARSTGSFWLLDRRLRREGFEVTRLAYASRRLTIGEAEAALRDALEGLPGSVSLIGHSLGGVLAARILARPGGLDIARAVSLGAPHGGSAKAATVGRLPGARRLLGPALAEIAALGAPARPIPGLGAIAGRLPVAAPGRLVGLRGPNDGFVEVGSAIAGADRHVVIPSVHGWMPLSPLVAGLAARYLRSGRFEEPPC